MKCLPGAGFCWDLCPRKREVMIKEQSRKRKAKNETGKLKQGEMQMEMETEEMVVRGKKGEKAGPGGGSSHVGNALIGRPRRLHVMQGLLRQDA